jgi:hypothetical protein
MQENPFPFVKEVMEFRSSLTPETDRGCALMAAAYLSEQLERLLRATLVHDDAAIDDLFRHLGPLGSFSGRIEMCYAFGLLPAEARRDLHLIRKIRNDFGHVAHTLTFEDPGIADRCRELYHNAYDADGRARGRFTNTVMGVCAVVHHAIYKAAPRNVPSGTTMTDEMKGDVWSMAEQLADVVLKEYGLEAKTSPKSLLSPEKPPSS